MGQNTRVFSGDLSSSYLHSRKPTDACRECNTELPAACLVRRLLRKFGAMLELPADYAQDDLGVRVCGSPFHDPVRVRQFGPRWWHDLSVWAAYLPFSIGMVHGLDEKKRGMIPNHIELVEVPHGLFSVATSLERNTSDLRNQLDVSVTDRVALCLGFIADRKNLDLVIQSGGITTESSFVSRGQPSLIC